MDYSRAISIRPDRAKTYYERGKAYEMKGDGVKAEEDFARAHKLESKP